MGSVTERFAEFVGGFKYSDIPPEVRDLAKVAITDCIAVMVAGSREEAGPVITQWARDQGGDPSSGIPGAGFKTSPALAALVGGTTGHAMDFDDANVAMHGHPSVPVLPAVLALGHKLGASGEQVLAAYVAGFEVETKIGLATALPHYLKGWHTTSTLGCLGAAAACANLLGLDSGKIRHALGIAASHSSGLRQNFGTMTKPFHAGHAAFAGLTAATLAGMGFTADQDILDAPMGFASVFCGEGSYNFGPALDSLGKSFGLSDLGGLMIKKYPCCAFTHRAIDAMLQLVHERGVSPGDVQEMECLVQAKVPGVLIHHRPKTGLEGKFSMQHCLATALLEGRVVLRHFTDQWVNDSRVREYRDKVTMKVDPDQQTHDSPLAEYSTVIVTTCGGEKLSARVNMPKGSVGNPLTPQELEEKFRECCAGVIKEAAAEEALAILNDLENTPGIGRLMDLLTFELQD